MSAGFALGTAGAAEAATAAPPQTVVLGGDGRLVYGRDEQGNRVVDFSHAGYGGGGVAIPAVPVRLVVEPVEAMGAAAAGGDDRARIQAALDRVAALPVAADGFRGAVLLRPGRYRIDGGLRLAASGVVLRGSGEGENGTVLVAVAPARRTLLELGGTGERAERRESRRAVAGGPVPNGARTLTVEEAGEFPPGTRVVVRRPATAEWIAALGMNRLPGWRAENRVQWAPGSRDVVWDRTVTARDGAALTLDAPLTSALEAAWGGGTVTAYAFPGRIERVGVEHLRCVSEHDRARPLDEEHAWVAVSVDRVENAWVRQVTTVHFAGHAVNVQADARQVTVEDCTALDPVSEPAGYRRRTFQVSGQLTLVQRCRSERGLRDFTTGFAAAGPNVFLRCRADEALGPSGPAESWATGVLFDNVIVRGSGLQLANRGAEAQGAGWTAGNSVLWNCEATELRVQSPPGAPNQVFGSKGVIADDRTDYDPRRAPWRDHVRGGAVPPASLYEAQLAERKGAAAVAAMARAAIDPADGGAPRLAAADVPPAPVRRRGPPLRVEGGRFMIGDQPAWTATAGFSWYLGQMPRPLARSFGPAIVRFAPGESGRGATDVIADVVAGLPPGGVFVHHYGLWYDRRRINHNFYGSPDLTAEDATPPFMEMPWARSGVGRDWNGLSKYDLTRFNPWYFARVKEFADRADEQGRVLYHNFYFQHALQETRAHYVDFPWRPVNCLQATDLPDENPAGSAFYDVGHAVRRDLHRRYIRHCLDVLKDNTNVVHGLDREYSGPAEFVRFWLDTIAEWEQENGKRVLVALEVPKAALDAVLADPVRGPRIAAIDFHHWFYRPDGSLYAIEGGINEAPREQSARILPAAQVAELRAKSSYPGNIVNAPEFQRAAQAVRAGTPALRYRAQREYRDAFPHLVLLRRGDEFPALTAAVERAIPAAERARTRPAPLVRGAATTAWAMAAPGAAYLVYSMNGDAVELDLAGEPAAARFAVTWIRAETIEPRAAPDTVAGGGAVRLVPPAGEAAGLPAAAWLTRR